MLEQITMKALSRDPEQRFQTALELALALERFIGQAGGASTSHLGGLMREYFSTDQADWKSLVRTAHEIEEASAPIVSPIKMTATELKPITGSRPPTHPTHTRTSARTVAAAPTPRVGLPAIAGLFLLTVIALLLAVLLFGKPTPPAPATQTPMPRPGGPVHTLEPLPAPVAPAVEPAPSAPSSEAAPVKKKRPHRRSSDSSSKPLLGPDHRPNPFD
jgi:hypothetical protein